MKNLKKALAILICVVMLCGLSSCIQENKKPQERIVVRLAAPQNNYIEDFETNTYKLWLEEQTGLKIEMTWLPTENAEQIVRQQLISGEGLPDAYMGFGNHVIFNNYNAQKYGEQGIILSLNELIEKYGDNTKKLFDELPEYNIRALMTSADGHMYYMPGFSSSMITRYRQVMWVNKGWLDALNMSVPTTTDEFRDMLRAFKNNDPNGNGIRDEIPMAGTEEFYSKQVYEYLFNAFIYNNEKFSRLLLENGVVGFAPVRDEWREALRYMRGLYDEGLLSPLSFSQDDQQMKQMANDPRDILGAFSVAGITFTVQQNSPEMLQRYMGIAPLMGPGGVRLSTVSIPLPKPNGVITSACKNPDEVFKLFDLMLSEEACLIGRYGDKGIDWDFAEKGDVSIYGTPATIRIKNQLWNTLQNKHLCQIGPYVSRPKFSGGVTWDGTETDGEYINAQTALLYKDYEPDEFIGALNYTPDEESAIAEIRTGIDQFVKDSVQEFITGARDINDDEEWCKYIQAFDELGLAKFIATAQKAHDRIQT